MESRKLVDIEKKYNVEDEDSFVVEDQDGTKMVKFEVIKSALHKMMVCNTINNLKALNLPEGSIIRTLGYHKVDDGGAATYYIMYDPSATDDGALCHWLSGSDTLRAKLVIEGSVNVLAFGAVGDGLNDDYDALQKALDSGLPLHFPNKTYKVSSPLEIKSNTNIDFNGCTITCPNSAAIIIGNASTGANNVRLSNLNIIGYNGIEVLPKSSIISLNNISVIGQNVTSEYGVRLQSDKYIRIESCHFSNLQYGVTVYVPNTVINNGFISITNTDMQVSVQCVRTSGGASNISRINIFNCNFIVESAIDDTHVGLYLYSQSDHINITNCAFSGGYGALHIMSNISNKIKMIGCDIFGGVKQIVNEDSTTTITTI